METFVGDAEHFFIDATSTPITINFHKETYGRKLWLQQVMIKDAPVTLSVPDDPVIYLHIDGHTGLFLKVRDNASQGIPIPVTGAFSHTVFNPAIHVGTLESGKSKFKFQILDSDGTSASFSSIYLWFLLSR